MKWRLDLRREAEVDILSAASWYQSKSPGVELRFVQEVDDCVAFIMSNPRGPALVNRTDRQFPLKTFPFHVVFTIVVDVVLIMRVYHMKRDPRRRVARTMRRRR
ncbi:MAG: type II toxin-antitoxin system RelE/ParE family toxin [Flavobacteriales bacterium]|nr:type II toxin-antitoxin system RelE/ParE family toxin [Flavobacteriales bacterium]MBL0129433.1 type II toxin-antitoxin system RelE/ParE family toxin [Flavobacteriales bacterium]MCC6939148.1 type II toxin-antitoxin system RelE/ParE family toxin [Flavobacteriales bacterium]